MNRPEMLLHRLEAIGQSLERTGKAQALIGLGSVGVESARLDAYSDLDFFVVARADCKAPLIDDLSWLAAVHPVAYAFQNTPDGHKALFADEIYCEFAIFEADELAHIPFAEGRVVWQTPEFDRSLARPRLAPAPPRSQPVEWLLGEALTCLYVGMSRYRRGEKLSAFRFVQVFVVDRLLDLARLLEQESPGFEDKFSPERRFEHRFPATAALLASFMQGYDKTPQSARALLAFLDDRFHVNPAMKSAILGLCDD